MDARYATAVTLHCGLAALVGLGACNARPAPIVPEDRINAMSVVVSTESARLSGPVDLAVDEKGLLYVLDYSAAQVLVVTADGAQVRTIARPGSGPGELQRPGSLVVARESLRVTDPGNGRLQTLTLTGGFTRSVPLPPVSNMGPVAIAEDGGFLITTLGMHGTLAEYYDPSGDERARMGTPPDSVAPVVSPLQSKQDLVAGRVPALFRNAVLPVVAADGEMWLILVGEGVLQRYSKAGALQLSVALQTAEMKRVREEVVADAKATLDDPRHLKALRYILDAAVVGRTLWVLVNTTADGPAVLLAIDPTGQVTRRLTFPNIRGARAFVLDPSRARVFFALSADASVVASSLPDSVLRQ